MFKQVKKVLRDLDEQMTFNWVIDEDTLSNDFYAALEDYSNHPFQSEAHKELFCVLVIDFHLRYRMAKKHYKTLNRYQRKHYPRPTKNSFKSFVRKVLNLKAKKLVDAM